MGVRARLSLLLALVLVAGIALAAWRLSQGPVSVGFLSPLLDKAIEVQSDYFKHAYEGFVAKATKIGELYADLAKETYKPIEGAISKINPGK